nr:SgcJ/EcaC family oxidoreductase [Pedobacter panaciterrae]
MNQELETEKIIRATTALHKAFERQEFKAAAEYLTREVSYITFNGMYLKGREAYIKVHEEFMLNKLFRDAKLHGSIHTISFLNENTAVVIMTGAIQFRWQKKIPESRRSINTNVWVLEADRQWRLAAFQNSRIKKTGGFAKLMLSLFK